MAPLATIVVVTFVNHPVLVRKNLLLKFYNFEHRTKIKFEVPQYIYSLVFSLEGRTWQEPELSHVTGMALAHSILGKFLG